jgi:predicted HTH transcriptional regulator
MPGIEFVTYQGMEFVVVRCPQGARKPYLVSGETRPYIRVGSSNREVQDEEIRRLYVGEHGEITNREYRDLTGISRRWATKELQELVDLGILAMRGTGRGIHYVLVRD